MKPIVKKRFQRQRRKRRVRAAILGTAQRPRLSVFRSTHHVYAQLVDDMIGCTLCAAGSLSKGSTGGGERMTKSAMAKLVGRRLAENAVKLGITRVVFDRNGYRYHGRIRALADGAREGGLKF